MRDTSPFSRSDPNLEDLPWGTHIAHFYRTAGDLARILVPYFKAGLEKGEFCVWITAEPLDETQAREALAKAVPDLDRFVDSGQMEIASHDTWYLRGQVFDCEAVLERWTDVMGNALSSGWKGMRAAGNMSWLEEKHWTRFMAYERAVDNTIQKSPMTAICSYPLTRFKPADVVEIAGLHPESLVKRRRAWRRVQGPSRRSSPTESPVIRKTDKGWQAIFGAKIKTASGTARVVIGTEAQHNDFVAHFEPLDAELPGNMPDVRSSSLSETVTRVEETIRGTMGEILDRGGLPVPGEK
ncbi:MAG: MEDS domain-containing protein [Lentisphaerae bacterium]|nr:MEDS domain-containing protein [Lentisphaerota bacterium]